MTAPDPDPMPVFTIKAKDRLALAAVEEYAKLCETFYLPLQAAQVRLAIDEMIGWQKRHPDLIQYPDHEHVPVTGVAGE